MWLTYIMLNFKYCLKGVVAINTFWTNSVWYILLAIISIVLLCYVLLMSKNRKIDLGFFWSIFGFTLIIETVIYVFLRAYEYYPLVIPNSPKNDGVLGNIISQVSISVAALLICVFEISLRGIVLAAALFYFIEKLFIALGIYQVYWYRPWITFCGLTVLFLFFKKWYKEISNNSAVIKYFTILLGVLSLYLPTTNWIGILSGYFEIKDTLLMDPYISHAVITIPKYLIQMNIVYFLYNNKKNWTWYMASFALILTIDIILYYTNLMYVKAGFLLIYSAISFLTVYLYVYSMNKLLYKN
jgi:hypothetical protein